MPTCEHHEWLKKRDWPAVEKTFLSPDRDLDLLGRKYKERDKHGRLPHHWMAAKAQTHTHTLAFVGVDSIGLNPKALITRDNKGETPIDIAVYSFPKSPLFPRFLGNNLGYFQGLGNRGGLPQHSFSR